MKWYGGDVAPDGCPICESKDAVPIEFDRPVVLLCECNNCRKFIMKKETWKILVLRKDFKENRDRMSDFVRKYFEKYKKPLEIVSDENLPLAKDQMPITQIFEAIQTIPA